MKGFIFTCLIILFTSGLSAQVSSSHDTIQKRKIVVKLKDNTAIRGELITDSPASLTINTLAGKLVIPRENIVSVEKSYEKYYRVTLTDGSIFLGGVIKESKTEIVLDTESAGEVSLPIATIIKKEPIGGKDASDKSFANPHSTRYLFSPTAIPIEKGEGYYQNIYLLYNAVHFGVGDHISVGGGVVFPVAAFIAPKISYEVATNVHLGVGALAGATFIGMTSFGTGYGLITAGNREHNLTAGLGYGYLGQDWGQSPVLTISGMTRVGKHVSLVSENWYLPTENMEGAIFSLAMRTLGKRHSVDLGIISYYEFNSRNPLFFGIPFIGYVYKFGTQDISKPAKGIK